MSWVGAAIQSGASVLGNIIGNASARRREYRDWQRGRQDMELQNQHAIDFANMENQWNIEQWHRQNKYNSPIEQMARLRQAGLNPNLLYGSFNPGNASSSPTMSIGNAAEAKGYSARESKSVLEGLDVFGKFQVFKNAKLKNERLEIENDMARNELDSQNAKLEFERSNTFEWEGATGKQHSSLTYLPSVERLQRFKEMIKKETVNQTEEEIRGYMRDRWKEISRRAKKGRLQQDDWAMFVSDILEETGLMELAAKGVRKAVELLERITERFNTEKK